MRDVVVVSDYCQYARPRSGRATITELSGGGPRTPLREQTRPRSGRGTFARDGVDFPMEFESRIARAIAIAK